ncbi:antitoxin ChpS [compost metagenome]
MSRVALRKSGGSLIISVPAAFVAQNHLSAGSQVECTIVDNTLVIKPARSRPSLTELIAQTPKDALAPGWDDMPPVGNEKW